MCYNEDGDDMEKYNPVYVITVMVCICLFSFLSAYFSHGKKDVDKKDKQDTVEKDTTNNEENKEK